MCLGRSGGPADGAEGVPMSNIAAADVVTVDVKGQYADLLQHRCRVPEGTRVPASMLETNRMVNNRNPKGRERSERLSSGTLLRNVMLRMVPV